MFKFVVLTVNVLIFSQVPVNTQPDLTGTLQNVDPIKVNEAVFSDLPLHFQNIGPVLYDVMTSPNALGKELSSLSSVIINDIGFQNYRKSVNEILGFADETDISGRITPLYERVKDLGTERGTLSEAVEIISNILQDDEAVNQLRTRITSSPVLSTAEALNVPVPV